MSIDKFSIIGSAQEDLIEACTFIISHIGKIKSVEKDEKNHIIIFHSYGDNGTRFPIEVTPIVLAETIRQFIEGTPQKFFDNLGEQVSGDYDHAWEILSPNWYSEANNIERYDLSTVLVCRPTIIEYDK